VTSKKRNATNNDRAARPINESDESISVKAEVPGFNEKELQVTMEPNRLAISGKRESSKEEKKGRRPIPRPAPTKYSASWNFRPRLTRRELPQC
jgi:HSP20 family molecular chaperone IbpA